MSTKKLKAGEILFKENDPAKDIYFLQSGQIRLFQSKGKGFIELGIMRSGDLIGETILGQELSSEPRSYHAEAISECELLVTNLEQFNKSIQDVNGGSVKVIMNALTNKLRKLSQKVKEFEQNSLSYGENDYVFIKDNEVGKILSMIYLTGMTFGTKEEKDDLRQTKYNRKLLHMYASDIFGLAEAKIENLFVLLKEFKIGSLDYSPQDGSSIIHLSNLELLKNIINFYQAERFIADEKKLKVSQKCLTLLEKVNFKIIDGAILNKTKDDAWFSMEVDDILEFFKERNLGIEIEEFDESKKAGITRDILINKDAKHEVEVNVEKMKKYLPILKFQQAIKKLNVAKTKL